MEKIIVSVLLACSILSIQESAQASLSTWVGGQLIKGFKIITKASPIVQYGDNAMDFFYRGRVTRAMATADGELGDIYTRYGVMWEENYRSNPFSCDIKCNNFLKEILEKYSSNEKKVAALVGLSYLGFVGHDSKNNREHKQFLIKNTNRSDIREVSKYFSKSLTTSLIEMMNCPSDGKDNAREDKRTYPRHMCD